MKYLIATCLLMLSAIAGASDAERKLCASYASGVQTVATMRDKGAPMDRIMALSDDRRTDAMVAKIYHMGWKSPQELAGSAFLECLDALGLEP